MSLSSPFCCPLFRLTDWKRTFSLPLIIDCNFHAWMRSISIVFNVTFILHSVEFQQTDTKRKYLTMYLHYQLFIHQMHNSKQNYTPNRIKITLANKDSQHWTAVCLFETLLRLAGGVVQSQMSRDTVYKKQMNNLRTMRRTDWVNAPWIRRIRKTISAG